MCAWTRGCDICGHSASLRDVLLNEHAVVLCPVCRGTVDVILREVSPPVSDQDLLAAARRAWPGPAVPR